MRANTNKIKLWHYTLKLSITFGLKMIEKVIKKHIKVNQSIFAIYFTLSHKEYSCARAYSYCLYINKRYANIHKKTNENRFVLA